MYNKIEWLTTLANPKRPATGYDAGQTGWKLHCVQVINDSFKQTGRAKALCGLIPAYGWSLDLFVEDRCKKCLNKLK
jgi:hypothetical protein